MLKKVFIALLVVVIMILSGCSQTIEFRGEEKDVLDVEEIIADELEVENPGEDIEVNVSVGVDD